MSNQEINMKNKRGENDMSKVVSIEIAPNLVKVTHNNELVYTGIHFDVENGVVTDSYCVFGDEEYRVYDNYIGNEFALVALFCFGCTDWITEQVRKHSNMLYLNYKALWQADVKISSDRNFNVVLTMEKCTITEVKDSMPGESVTFDVSCAGNISSAILVVNKVLKENFGWSFVD